MPKCVCGGRVVEKNGAGQGEFCTNSGDMVIAPLGSRFPCSKASSTACTIQVEPTGGRD